MVIDNYLVCYIVDQDKVGVVFRDRGKSQPLVQLVGSFVCPKAADEDRKSLCVSLYIFQHSGAYTLPLEGREKMDFRHVEEVRSALQLEKSGVSAVHCYDGKLPDLLEIAGKLPSLDILVPAP